jgi:hypothetical protein
VDVDFSMPAPALHVILEKAGIEKPVQELL